MPLDLTALGETVRRVYDKKVAEGVYTTFSNNSVRVNPTSLKVAHTTLPVASVTAQRLTPLKML